jgi:hypothetical protein
MVVVSGGFNVNYYNITKVVTGIENVHDDVITIYPNPVSKEMIIRSTNFIYNNVDIIDMMGKTVFSKITAYESELHLQMNLPNGTYFVNMSNGKQSLLKKIIVE